MTFFGQRFAYRASVFFTPFLLLNNLKFYRIFFASKMNFLRKKFEFIWKVILWNCWKCEMCCFKASQPVVNAIDSTKKCFENLLGTKFDSCNQRNTHLGMKYHCTAGLQFTRLDSTKKGKSVVISMLWSSCIQTCKTWDQLYNDTCPNGDCSLLKRTVLITKIGLTKWQVTHLI